MSDTNDILRKLAAQAGGEAALSALERALSSADGRRAVSSLSASHEALLRAAADRAASGDLSLPVRSHAASPPPRRAQSSPTPCAAAWEGRAVDNDALSGLLNDPEALQNALRSVSSLLGASDAGGAPDAVSPADDPEAQLLPVITGIMQSGRAAVRPEKRALLSALRPFVAEDVASQFDRALRLAGMAGMARAALGQLEHRAEGGEHSV